MSIRSGYFYSASSSPLLLRGVPDSLDTVSEFHAEAPQATTSEGLAQGPYVAVRAGFEPATLRTKGAKSTNELPRLTDVFLVFLYPVITFAFVEAAFVYQLKSILAGTHVATNCVIAELSFILTGHPRSALINVCSENVSKRYNTVWS